MFRGIRFAAAALLLCLPTAAQALEYSADIAFHWEGTAPEAFKVYVSNEKVRIQRVGAKTYELIDEAKHTDFVINPDKKFYYAYGPTFARTHGARFDVGPNLCTKVSTPAMPATCTKLGLDKINGHVVEKWNFSRPSHGQKTVWTNWIDPSLNAVVKVNKGTLTTYQLLNVKLGPQPASLFVVPAGKTVKQLGDEK